MRPGYETPEIRALCDQADAAVRKFAEEHQIPLYDKGGSTPTGSAPIVMVLAAIIEENRHLNRMLNLILEPGT